MLYQHRHFKLDTKNEEVFDEHGKKIPLTGNPFWLLVFLCENKSASTGDIADYLETAEGSKIYNNDHIRQYRYKIKTAVGYDVIKYENKRFFIDGQIEKIEEKTISEKNEKTKKSAFKFWPILLIAVVVFSGTFLFLKNRNKSSDINALHNQEKSVQKLIDEMILIPAGEFLMGSTEKQALEAWRINDGHYDKEGCASP